MSVTIREPGLPAQSPGEVAGGLCVFVRDFVRPALSGRAARLRGNLAQWEGNVRVPAGVVSLWNRCKEGERMTYDRLVCANCAAPVNEGRCPVCRANRQRLQQEHFLAGMNPWR